MNVGSDSSLFRPQTTCPAGAGCCSKHRSPSGGGHNPKYVGGRFLGVRALLAVLVLLTLAFAGCSGKGTDDKGASSSSSTSKGAGSSAPSSSGSSGGTSPVGINHAPTGAITADTNGTNATFRLSGSDQDGDDLAWDLTFGDGEKANGTDLPAIVNHAYVTVGNFSANFTLSDGTQTFAVNLTVHVASAASAVAQDLDFEYTVGNAGCTGSPDPGVFGSPADGVLWATWPVDATTIGLVYVIEFAGNNPASVGNFAFYDGDDTVVPGSAVTGLALGPMTGTVPTGAVNAMFVDCAGGGQVSGHYHAG